MESTNYSTFRQNLATMFDQVTNNHEPLLVTRQNAAPAVVMSLEDFKAFEESVYLMRSPKNATRLAAAIAEIEKGKKLEQHDIVE